MRKSRVMAMRRRERGDTRCRFVGAAILSTSRDEAPARIVTDHLNSARLIQNAMASAPAQHAWSSLPARALYRWLLDVLQHHYRPPRIEYTRAHTGSSTPESIVNDIVDRLASSSQHHTIRPPPMPVPTFSLDDFSLFSTYDSYIDSDILTYITSCSSHDTLSDPSFRPAQAMCLPLYDTRVPPEHPYTRASSSFSAVVQLYARSSQLDTALTRHKRFGDTSPYCTFGCPDVETTHHIFIDCPTFKQYRESATAELLRSVRTCLSDVDIPIATANRIIRLSSNLFLDDAQTWPLHASRYYLGNVPRITSRSPQSLSEQRLFARITGLWHTSCIRLAGHIWGEYKRRIYKDRRRALPTTEATSIPLCLEHLRYLA